MTGNWSTYEARLAAEEAARRAAEEEARREQRKASRPRGGKGRRTRATATGGDEGPYARWSIDELEEAIIDCEQKLSDLDMQFADPEVYRNADRSRSLQADSQALRNELAQLNAAWEDQAAADQ
jgi:hypothetical protein